MKKRVIILLMMLTIILVSVILYKAIAGNEIKSRTIDYLEEKGYRNSGVALTRVVDEEGERSYEMTLHHKNLYKLSTEEQETILKEIATMAFHVSGCKFQVKLLS